MQHTRTLLDWIGALTVTQGRLAGQPFVVLPWQRRFLRGAFADGVSSAAVSMGRGNGKSAFTAAIVTAAIAGPLARARADVVCVASSFTQARIIYEQHPGVPAAVDRDRAVPVADSGFGEPRGHRGSENGDARPLHRLGPEAGARTRSTVGARGRTGAVAGEHLGADAGRARHGAREDPAEPVHRARDQAGGRGALVLCAAPGRTGHLPPVSRGQARRSAVQETDMAASESVLAADAGS